MLKLIINGEMRSGTTFLASLINSQKKSIIYSDYLRSILNVFGNVDLANGTGELSTTGKNILISSLIAELKMHGLQIGQNHLDRNSIDSWMDLVNNAFDILSSYSRDENIIVGIKKTGRIPFNENLLANGYKIISIVRDPRDVILSAKNRFGGFNKYQFIKTWIEYIEASLTNTHENFLMIRYEDLVLKKKSTISEISKFLEIDIDLTMKTLQNNGMKFDNNSSFGDVKELFDKSALYRWKNHTEDPDLIWVNFLCNKYIEKLHYESMSLNLSKFNQLKIKIKYLGKNNISTVARVVMNSLK